MRLAKTGSRVLDLISLLDFELVVVSAHVTTDTDPDHSCFDIFRISVLSSRIFSSSVDLITMRQYHNAMAKIGLTWQATGVQATRFWPGFRFYQALTCV